MNLKELLANKIKGKEKAEGQDAEPTKAPLSPPSIPTAFLPAAPYKIVTKGEDDEEGVLLFLLLYYKSNKKDTFVEYGEGARLLYSFLGSPSVPHSNYPAVPLGHAIADHYIISNIIGLPHNAVYWILEKFRVAKNPGGG